MNATRVLVIAIAAAAAASMGLSACGDEWDITVTSPGKAPTQSVSPAAPDDSGARMGEPANPCYTSRTTPQ